MSRMDYMGVGYDFTVALDGRDGWIAFRQEELEEVPYKPSLFEKIRHWWLMNTVLRPYKDDMKKFSEDLIKEAEEKGLI